MTVRTSSRKPKASPDLIYAEGEVLINQPGPRPAAPACGHIIAFEDLFKTQRGAAQPDFAQVQAALFLTFCFSRRLLQPLVERGVKFFIAANFSSPLGEKDAKPRLPVETVTNKLDETFHPKLFLIRFARFLRVVVGSGNLLAEDWSAFGNCFYVRDFALLDTRLDAPRSQFHEYLGVYLAAVFGAKLPQRLAALDLDLLRYDMGDDCPLLVGSVPGQYELQGQQHGFPLLAQLLHARPPAQPFSLGDVRVVCLTSSLGALNLYFLHTLLRCFVPEMPFAKTELRGLSETQRRAFLDTFHIVFPTEEYVERARAAPDCLFFRRTTYEGFSFEPTVLSTYAVAGALEKHTQVVPHYKAIIVTYAPNFGVTDDTVVYLGSHNLTKPAWGRATNFDQRFSVWNYELGVVLPPRPGSAAAKRTAIARLGFAFPPQRYSSFDTPFFNAV